jgi:hypothetical protein
MIKPIPIKGVKSTISFPAGELPDINPDDPRFTLDVGGFRIEGRLNPKSARKLKAHPHGAALVGNLRVEGGKLVLGEAGVQFFEPKPAAASSKSADTP